MILIAGAGAIGQWLAARLYASGQQVVALARPAHAAALENLQITGETTFLGPIRAVTDVASAAAACPEGYQAIFITTKAHQTADMAAAVAPLVAADGVLASLQNGLGNAAKLAAHVPADRVAVCLTSHGVTMHVPGHIEHAGAGPTRVGGMPDVDPASARRIHGLLGDAGLTPEWVDDVAGHVWQKAIVNNGINPLAGSLGVENGALLRPDLFERAKALVEEGVALSRAAGIRLPPGDCLVALWNTLERTRTNRCSMLQDVDAHRPTEIEQITGHFIRLARRLGYPMFASEDAYRDIKGLEESYLGEAHALALTRAEVEWESRAQGASF